MNRTIFPLMIFLLSPVAQVAHTSRPDPSPSPLSQPSDPKADFQIKHANGGLLAVTEVCHLRPLLDAIRRTETGGRPRAGRDTVGDGGRSLGPYQIQRAYHRDGCGCPDYERVRDADHAEITMLGYWRRHCPAALRVRDYETLARVHNGGPAGARKTATLGYWTKVRRELP